MEKPAEAVTCPDMAFAKSSPLAGTLRIESIECAADIVISENIIIGRRDIARFLDPDDLSCISKEHIRIILEDDDYFIEDLQSVNGTRLNGENIGGMGRVPLINKSIIDIAGAVQLLFVAHSKRKTV
jgi:pSer/pThr/pTyr-binding forkhead associated (FHA) protein